MKVFGIEACSELGQATLPCLETGVAMLSGELCLDVHVLTGFESGGGIAQT